MQLPTSRSAWSAMLLLAIAELFGMSLWFSASAVVPALRAEWGLSDAGVTWLTLAVQLGFVLGTFTSAILNLPDVFKPRHLIAMSAIGGSVANGCFALFAHAGFSATALRFMTGFFLAGVYPPGMKVMASWFTKGRGAALGVLIGALTLGKATPYLINAIGSQNWRMNLLAGSALALLCGIIVLFFVTDGPQAVATAPFDPSQVKKVLTDRAVRLANFGYFGHMWELYAMWTWIPLMIRASFAAQHQAPHLAETASFLIIAAGTAGCIVAGILADRIGRTVVASAAMIISGLCCLTIGLLFHAPPFWLLLLALIWGASVVADSAQFSACVTELADRQYVGTALTLQTCIGFLITAFSVQLIPILVRQVGWEYAFIALFPGPLLGTLAMVRLRSLPEAAKVAGGKR
jgi:MFS family permease